ncbi:MAG: hypothetical protein ACYCOO_06585 [Chitinophagaceae bacterium]
MTLDSRMDQQEGNTTQYLSTSNHYSITSTHPDHQLGLEMKVNNGPQGKDRGFRWPFPMEEIRGFLKGDLAISGGGWTGPAPCR